LVVSSTVRSRLRPSTVLSASRTSCTSGQADCTQSPTTVQVRPRARRPSIRHCIGRDVLRLVDDDVREGPVVPLLGQAPAGRGGAVGVRGDADLGCPVVELGQLVPAVVLGLASTGGAPSSSASSSNRAASAAVSGAPGCQLAASAATSWSSSTRGPGPGAQGPFAQRRQDRPGQQDRPGGVQRAAERRVVPDPRGEVVAAVRLHPGGLRAPLPRPPGELDQRG
jgi:hypothetical protein